MPHARQAIDGLKQCFTCKNIKAVELFVRSKRSKDGCCGRCLECTAAYARSRRPIAKPYVPKTKEQAAAIARERASEWYKNNKTRLRNTNLKKWYGLTIEDYESMFSSQGRVCFLCGGDEHKGNNWAVDHDHMTGRIRKILCNPCNRALGLVKENRRTLQNMIDYLKYYAALDEKRVIEEENVDVSLSSEYGPEDITPEMWADFEMCLENYDPAPIAIGTSL